MWKLAFRNIFRHQARTALTLAAISFGVIALILAGGFVQDIYIQLREAVIHSQFGHLQVYRAGFGTFGRRSPYQYMISNPERTVAELRQLEHVVDIMPRVNFSALLSNGRSSLPVIGEGIDPEKEVKLSSYMRIKSGRQISGADAFGILLGEGVANALKVSPGDQVTLLLNTPEGALNTLDLEVLGVFQTFAKDYDDRAVRVSLSAARQLLATKAVHKLVIALTDSNLTEKVAARVRQTLPPREFELKTWYELADFYQKAVDLYQRYFAVLRLIILGMVLLSVANSVNMTIYERTGEFGTLMALGNRRGDVATLIVVEMLMLGLIGSAVGVVLGVALATAVSSVGIPMPPVPNTNTGYTALIRVVPAEVERAFLVGLFATLAASLLPAFKASRRPVVEALRHN
ncbi:MAG TPA: ABC transporter permease [Candidatus Acidoferrales bacterium]|nr:ABC transporter permease [Candidatus Acidoferrales bacterium]